MSKIIATKAIRGAHKIVTRAKEDLAKAIDESGIDSPVAFPDTNYYLPFAYAMLGIKAQKAKDLLEILKYAESLLPPIPSENVWLPYLGPTLDAGMATLFAQEIIEVLKYSLGNTITPTNEFWVGFTTDAILREQGIKLVDGRMPGFAAIVGAAPTNEEAVRLVRELQERRILIFMSAATDGKCIAEQLAEEEVQMGWDMFLVPHGKDITSTVYALNFAALHKLPILFICENNEFSVYTRLNERQAKRPIYRIAEAHGLTSYVGNGNDVEEVFSIAKTAVDSARQGKGPQFIELSTYRWREHCGPDFDDHLGYRAAQEIEIGLKDCPIAKFTTRLKQNNTLSQADVEQFEAEIDEEVSDAFKFALSSAKPSTKDAGERVYA